MDKWMEKYAMITKNVIPSADPMLPGSGAAGGLGFALTAYLGAELKKGINIVLKETEAEKHIKDADIVITGDGRLDSQSVMGKVPAGVAAEAKKAGKPVIAFAGCIGDGAEACNSCGINAFFPILRKVCTLPEAMDNSNAYNNLKATVSQVFKLIKDVGKLK